MIEETMNAQQRQQEFAAPQPTQNKANNEIETKLRGLILDTFNTPSGMALLELWDDIYTRQVTWQPGCAEGYAQYRAGQNHVVLITRAYLNQAKKAGASE